MNQPQPPKQEATELRERINKSLDFFTEPGKGERFLKDLEDELVELFNSELKALESRLEGEKKTGDDAWLKNIKSFAYENGFNEAIDTCLRLIKEKREANVN